MSKIDKNKFEGLTPKKKEILKSLMGSVSSKIDFNKVRDSYKYGEE